MFARAGANWRHKSTGVFGWTRALEGRSFALAELIRFTGGDLAWMDAKDPPRFLSWGEQCVLGSLPDFVLPTEWQVGLPQSRLSANGLKPRAIEARLELPYPVSANRYWRHVPNKKTGLTMHFLSDEAKAYKEAVGWIAKASGFRVPTDKPIEVRSITLCPRTHNEEGKRIGARMDLGNCWKIAEDALQGVVYVNDRQIQRFGRIQYGEPTRQGALIVEVAEFDHPALPLFAEEEAAA